MEELLLDVMKESSGPKGAQLRETCQAAYGKILSACGAFILYDIHTYMYVKFYISILDLLSTQQGTTRDPSHELRRVCFVPLQIALETKRPKLISLSLNGFHVRSHFFFNIFCTYQYLLIKLILENITR